MAKLQKRLNLWGLTMIAVGACIGSGIFVVPGHVAQDVPHHGLIILVWFVGGIIAMTGALTFSELGAMYPKAGGVYVFLKEAYGDFMGFLYGWVILLVITTGALAALALVFADYMTFFIPLSDTGKIILAICTISGLTLANITGINTSQWMAKIFTGGKLLAMIVIVLLGFWFYDSTKVSLDFNFASIPENATHGLLLGLIGVLWSMGGWHHASYLASETIDAKRTLPRAMVLGVGIVMSIYILINIAYMMLLPLSDIAATEKVAGEAMAVLHPAGGKIMAIIIAMSVFGTIAIYTMSAPRIYYAMAEDKVFFSQLKNIHPRFNTPANAMLLQASWAIILLLFWQTFKDLITYVTFMDIIFMTLAGISVFVLRKKKPDLPRPVKTWGYPVVPLIFILISTAFLISTFVEKPQQAWAGLIILGIGFPIYYLFKRSNSKT